MSNPFTNLTRVKTYPGVSDWEDAEIQSALNAEMANQKKRCKVPVDGNGDDDYPDDLAEALCRRVVHNLALRNLPLGIQAAVSELSATQTRVGGMDAEVLRLEGPYRKRIVG